MTTTLRNIAGVLCLLAAVAMLVVPSCEWTPSVEPGPRYVIVVEESRDRTPAQAIVTEGISLYCGEHKPKHGYRRVDDDHASQEILEAIESTGVPAIVILEKPEAGKEGRRLYVGSLPKSVEAAVSLIQKWGG